MNLQSFFTHVLLSFSKTPPKYVKVLIVELNSIENLHLVIQFPHTIIFVTSTDFMMVQNGPGHCGDTRTQGILH